MEDENVYLQGTRDSAVNEKEHAYVVFEVLKCSNDTREEDDPLCEEPDKITEWIETKLIQIKVIDYKIDFTTR